MASIAAAADSRTMTIVPGGAARGLRRRPTVLGLALLVVACTGQSGPTGNLETSAAPSAPAPVTATSTPSARPTASPRTPAPAALQGRWRTVINDNDKPVLTITDFKYTIERLGIGTGSIEVHGDQIDFFGSNLCSGKGTYGWSIEGGTLTLTAVGADPCANRADAIRGRPFTKIE